ncbi:MAG: saccharopine dehydrogenase NADP-binding domain-containing protein, partial [Thermoleophilaceae bacterium]
MTTELSGPIAVYGATGYTGRLVAAEVLRRGADAVLMGRNAAKLEIVAEDLGGGVETRVAALDDAPVLREARASCAAVISCAGPFSDHGEPVLRAAIEAGIHYLDTTGEQTYIRRAFEEFGPEAQGAGVALLPAMGFDYAPG